MKARTYILLLIIMVSTGCEPDLLETIPNDRITSEIFWNQEKDALTTSNALYTFLDGTEKLRRDVFSDIAHTNTQFGDYKAIEIGAYNALSPVVEAEWQRKYKGIRAANYFLENIDKIPGNDEELINRLAGEARFIRAIMYVDLVSIFGDIPLITKTLTLDEARNVVRAPAEEVWDYIEEELNRAADQLPLFQTEEGRITKGAALALKARAMLYAKRYQKAADAAKKVMELEIYSLYPSYENLFTYAAENNSEVILDKQFIKNVYPNDVFDLFAPFSLLSNGVEIVPLKKIVDAYEMTNGRRIEDTNSGFDPFNPYENRDPRLYYSVFFPGSVLPDGKIYDSRPNSGTADAVGSNYQVSVTGYNIAKYINEEDITERANSGINIILIRYAEILLTYAEAKIELGQIDGSVFETINEVRQRPDVDMPVIEQPKSQEELRQIVRHERMVELAFEGQRFFDVRRWGIAEEVINKPILGITYEDDNGNLVVVDQPSVIRDFRPRDYLWPIPQKEIDLNKNLTQNPGYGD